MIVALRRHTDAVDLLLLDEPVDAGDIRDVRHWVRVYANLMELSADFRAQDSETPSLSRRLAVWRERLDFWQRRAREISNPKVTQPVATAVRYPNRG